MRRPQDIFKVVALICALFLFAGPAAAQAGGECLVRTLDIPNLSTLALTDGHHVIASVDTEHGRLEARVTVRGKSVSAPEFFLSDRRMVAVPEAKLPKRMRACFRRAEKEFAKGESRGFIRRLAELLVPRAHAVTCLNYRAFVICDDAARKCCADVRCGTPANFAWAHACASY